MRGRRWRRYPAALAVSLLLAAGTAGCVTRPLPAVGRPLAVNPLNDATRSDCGDQLGQLPAPVDDRLALIRRRGRLVAGVSRGTPGFALLGPGDPRPQGFDADIVREVARAIFGNPDQVEYRYLNTKDRLGALDAGSVDLEAANYSITCGRWQALAFSKEYYRDDQKVLVANGSRAAAALSAATGRDDLIARLRGRPVCATTDSTSIYFLQAHTRALPWGVDDNISCLALLQAGMVDAVATDESIIRGLQSQDPNTTVLDPGLVTEPHGIAMGRGHRDLVEFVDRVLGQICRDGTWQRIYDRWLGQWLATTPQVACSRGA